MSQTLGKDARACSGADPNRIGDQLTFAEKKRVRGMLADKQGVAGIAEELECSVGQVQAIADTRVKPALSAFMFFSRDSRETAVAELGSSDPKMVSKRLGEKWAAQADRSPWESQSAKDKARFERENAIYQAALQAEEDEEDAANAAKAAGPSEREEERALKRQQMDEEMSRRAEKPKAPKKARVLTADEKALAAQNKAVMGDKEAAAKQRLNFLLGQSDLFKHFGLKEDAEGAASKKKGKRKSEKEEDEEMMGDVDGAEAGGKAGAGFEEKVRVTKQPDLINKDHGDMRAYQVRPPANKHPPKPAPKQAPSEARPQTSTLRRRCPPRRLGICSHALPSPPLACSMRAPHHNPVLTRGTRRVACTRWRASTGLPTSTRTVRDPPPSLLPWSASPHLIPFPWPLHVL